MLERIDTTDALIKVRFTSTQTSGDLGVNVDFIRILFVDPVEEEIAYRWASRLARLIGEQAIQAIQLRPATTLAEMLRWAATARIDSMVFVVVFEPELRMELAGFLDYCEDTTFREMVEHCAELFANRTLTSLSRVTGPRRDAYALMVEY